MLVIDGSRGEGGGQILRTSLTLSAITGTAIRIERIRARRAKPGLQRQHLAAVHAAVAIANAEIEGDRLGSSEIVFTPRVLVAGVHRFAVTTAGSGTLILQTVLPALLRADAPSRLMFEGGTHNPLAPTFDFLDRTFLPVLRRLGARVEARLDRHGFYPAGGGRFEVWVEPGGSLARLELLERGALVRRRARSLVARLPLHIAERELAVVRTELRWREDECAVQEIVRSTGPGNVLLLEVDCEHATEVFAGFGQKGVPAEHVALGAVQELQAWLDASVPVGPHLADQLLLPLALGSGGVFRTFDPTEHFRTNVETIAMFGVATTTVHDDGETCVVEVLPRR